ncbi:LysM peptidoglycan-binding domain-containing protein [Hymenobacter antarcticus]|uniref:LysM domain-containing protein n=1 Tax=Hymenobacter antarcticus TaxID=486270 RepID=A0ABP7PMZ1_9BACT
MFALLTSCASSTSVRVALSVGALALLGAAAPATPPALTTDQLTARLSAAIENLKTLRCTVKAQERIGGNINQARSIMKLTYKPLRIYIKNQKGVEVLWVAGQNGGDAWVYPASFPYVTLSLDPKGKLMRSSQHHTALQAGFGTISDLLRTTGLRQDNSFSRSFRFVGDTMVQGRPGYVLRSDYPQFRYVSYKAGKNETISTVAERFGCGEYRVVERNGLSIGDNIPEGKVLQVPNSYGRRTVVCVDSKTYLPTLVQVNDDKGLFEKFEFTDVVPNQTIPLVEFTKDYKDYKL